MQRGPVTTVSQEHAGEEYGMEVDIIFTHKLEEFHILGIEPPLLPLRGKVGCDARVSDRSIELDAMVCKIRIDGGRKALTQTSVKLIRARNYTAIQELTKDFALYPILFRSFVGHWNAPCQVSGHWTRSQPSLESTIDDNAVSINDRVGRPFPRFPGILDPLLCSRLDSIELDIHMR